MASGKESTVQECEDYVEKHGIQAILKDCIAKLCQERPANPYKFLREYFEKQEKVIIPCFTSLSLPFLPPFPYPSLPPFPSSLPPSSPFPPLSFNPLPFSNPSLLSSPSLHPSPSSLSLLCSSNFRSSCSSVSLTLLHSPLPPPSHRSMHHRKVMTCWSYPLRTSLGEEEWPSVGV